VVGHNLGVLVERDEILVARPALVGHQHDAVAHLGQFFDGFCVAFESAVVLDGAVVVDRRVEVKTNENALCIVEIIECVE